MRHRFQRRLWPVLLAMLCLLALFLVAWRRHGRDLADPLEATAASCKVASPTLFLFVVDDSESVRDTDPHGHRYPEAQRVAHWMARHSCNRDDRFGVVHFASTAGLELEPTKLSTSLDLVDAALERPDDTLGGGTELSPALSIVEEMHQRFPKHQLVVAVFSDGALDSGDRGPSADLMRVLPVRSVHLVQVGEPDPGDRAYWQSLGDVLGSGSEQQTVDEGETARALAELWTAATR